MPPPLLCDLHTIHTYLIRLGAADVVTHCEMPDRAFLDPQERS